MKAAGCCGWIRINLEKDERDIKIRGIVVISEKSTESYLPHQEKSRLIWLEYVGWKIMRKICK